MRSARPAAALLAAVSLVVAVLAAPAAGAATIEAPTTPDGSAMVSYGLRVDVGDPALVAEQLVRDGYDVVDRNGQTIFALGAASSRSALDGIASTTVISTEPAAPDSVAAAPASQDAILPRRLDGKAYETFYGGYRTADAYLEFTDDLAAAYPDLVKSIKYGESWSGDELRAVCVTSDADAGCQRDPDVAKVRFFVVAQTHARELSTSELMWRYLTYLVDGYGHDAQVTGLLDGTEVWIVPQVNPDGIRTVEDGITDHGLGQTSPAWQRKNLNDTYSSSPCGGPWGSSQEGVDLNRNFDVDWGRTGTSDQPCSLVFGGPDADSEPETTAQEELMLDLYRDRRDPGMDAPAPKSTTGSMLTLHSYANEVLLPWGFTTQHAPNDAGLRSFGFRMSNFNHYETGQSGEILYNSSGATEDWLYAELGVPGFTWEMGPGGGTCAGFFPPYSCQDGFWEANRAALMYTGEAARQPYALTLGPTTGQVKARAKRGKIVVSAITDDDAFGSTGVGRPAAQNITAARIYVGTAPWDGGTPTPMRVRDSGTSAKITVKVAKPGSRKIAYVQGRDASGEWGPATPVWLKP
jgi:carboxypeptidase T